MSRIVQGRTAIGLRAHSGWAALVAVTGSAAGIEILARRRIELADPDVPGSKQPYHEAEGLPSHEARDLLDRLEASAESLARDTIRLSCGSTIASSLESRSVAKRRPKPSSAEVVPSPCPPPNLADARNPPIDVTFFVTGSTMQSVPVRPAGTRRAFKEGAKRRSSKPIPASPPGSSMAAGPSPANRVPALPQHMTRKTQRQEGGLRRGILPSNSIFSRETALPARSLRRRS